MQLTKLIYVSHHGGVDSEACADVLQRSRINNARDGITGALVVSDDDFMQVLEGSRTVVAKCFMRIMQDPRHRQIQILLACEINSRLFPDWSMHFTKASRLRQSIKHPRLLDDLFRPDCLSQATIEDLCGALALQAQRKIPSSASVLRA